METYPLNRKNLTLRDSIQILDHSKNQCCQDTCDYFEKRRLPFSSTNTLFLLQVPHNLMMTAEEFILFPKYLYVKEQPHAACVLHDNNINYKIAQLSYLNRLRPQLPPQTSKTTATKETFTENVEHQQEQLKLLTDDEEVPVERDKDKILDEKHNRQTESILGQ